MSIVSISEAARLTGKSRNTLHAQIRTGKLSCVHNPVTNSKGLDTSELLRVFGSLKGTPSTAQQGVTFEQQITPNIAPVADSEKEALKAENDKLKALLEAKQETIDSLNRALLLLEHKPPTDPQPQEEKLQPPPKKSFWSWFKK